MDDLDAAVRRSTFLAGLVGWWRDRRHSGRPSELTDMDDRELVRLARDYGMTAGDLVDIAERGTGAAMLMDRMLAAHRMSTDMLRTREPAVIRDMEIACSRCGEKVRCAEELAEGSAVRHCDSFCPNSQTIRALMAEVGVAPRR